MAKIKLVGVILDNDTAQVYSWWGFDSICARTVENGIRQLAEGEELEIDLNSPGGYCSVGAEIYTMLKQASQNGHKVTINVIGEACSAATVLMCGADVVNGSPVSVYMFHNASVSAQGKARDMRSAMECLEQTDDVIVNAYELKTGHSREELHNLIDEETWMSVNRAKEYGFVDNILFSEGTEEEESPDEEEMQEENSMMLDMVRACAVSGKLIPEDKVHLMRNVMLEEIAKEKAGQTSKVKDVNTKGININKKPKGDKKMTLEEMYEQHPELKDEVESLLLNSADSKTPKDNEVLEDAIKEAIAGERKRIQDIEEIAGSIPADMVTAAKYTDPCDAKELAFKALVADSQKATGYMEKVKEDFEKSGAKDVVATPEDDGEGKSNELAGFVNSKRKKGEAKNEERI